MSPPLTNGSDFGSQRTAQEAKRAFWSTISQEDFAAQQDFPDWSEAEHQLHHSLQIKSRQGILKLNTSLDGKPMKKAVRFEDAGRNRNKQAAKFQTQRTVKTPMLQTIEEPICNALEADEWDERAPPKAKLKEVRRPEEVLIEEKGSFLVEAQKPQPAEVTEVEFFVEPTLEKSENGPTQRETAKIDSPEASGVLEPEKLESLSDWD